MLVLIIHQPNAKKKSATDYFTNLDIFKVNPGRFYNHPVFFAQYHMVFGYDFPYRITAWRNASGAELKF
jgi:hypothetical protein